jgi:hypothetical protein
MIAIAVDLLTALPPMHPPGKLSSLILNFKWHTKGWG